MYQCQWVAPQGLPVGFEPPSTSINFFTGADVIRSISFAASVTLDVRTKPLTAEAQSAMDAAAAETVPRLVPINQTCRSIVF